MRILGVLAGGLGTRLRRSVNNVPKPMAPIGRIPFLECLIREWISLDDAIDKIFISVGYKREIIQKHFGGVFQGIPVAYVIEEKALGTGGAALRVFERCDDELFLINGDSWFIPPKNVVSDLIANDDPCIHILLKEVLKTDRFGGVEVDDNGLISSFCSELLSARFINGGVYRFSRSAMMLLKRLCLKGQLDGTKTPLSLENDLFPNLLIEKEIILKGVIVDQPFLDIGVPEDYTRAEKFIAENKRKERKDNL